MRKQPLRELLLKFWWSQPELLPEVEVTFLHRGVPGNSRSIRGSEIVKIGKDRIFLKGREEIPLHRVTLVKLGKKVLYESKRAKGRR